MSDRHDHSNKTIEITYRDDVGETDGRSFAKWMGIGATAMTLLLITTISIGMIAGALGVGIGGFVASFGQVDATLEGEDGAIYPTLGEQPACAEAPQLMAYFPGTAEVTEHVAFYKDLPLPDSFAADDFARISIVSDEPEDLELEDLDLRFSALEADELNLTAPEDEEIEISEFVDFDEDGDAYDSYGLDADDNPTTLSGDELDENVEFGISIPEDSTVGIDDGLAAAHHVAFSSATLTDVDIFVTIGDNATHHTHTGIGDRQVAPEDRDDCDNLASESSPADYDNYP